MYLPATYKLKNLIKHVVYSNLNLKLMVFYCCPLGFLHSLAFHQLSALILNELILE